MLPNFYFSKFEPDEALQFEADRSLDEILSLAPEGTIAVARLEKDGENYRSAIDLYSKLGPFIARTCQPTPLLAVHHAVDILKNKLIQMRQIQKKRQEALESKNLTYTFAGT